MTRQESILRAQSQACKDYMRFLENEIIEERKKNTVRIEQPVKGTNSVIIYFKNK